MDWQLSSDPICVIKEWLWCRMMHLLVRLSSEKNCWVCLPPPVIARLFDAQLPWPLVLELRPLSPAGDLLYTLHGAPHYCNSCTLLACQHLVMVQTSSRPYKRTNAKLQGTIADGEQWPFFHNLAGTNSCERSFTLSSVGCCLDAEMRDDLKLATYERSRQKARCMMYAWSVLETMRGQCRRMCKDCEPALRCRRLEAGSAAIPSGICSMCRGRLQWRLPGLTPLLPDHQAAEFQRGSLVADGLAVTRGV